MRNMYNDTPLERVVSDVTGKSSRGGYYHGNLLTGVEWSDPLGRVREDSGSLEGRGRVWAQKEHSRQRKWSG